MDFTKLDKTSVRLLNSIIQHLAMNDIDGVEAFLGPNIKTIEIDTSNRVEQIAYIEQDVFCEILRKNRLNDDYDLYENLLFFICVHPQMAVNKIMVRKLWVALKKVGENSYYRSLGTELRKNPLEWDEENNDKLLDK